MTAKSKPTDTTIQRTYAFDDGEVSLKLKLPGDLPLERMDTLMADFAGEIQQALWEHAAATQATHPTQTSFIGRERERGPEFAMPRGDR